MNKHTILRLLVPLLLVTLTFLGWQIGKVQGYKQGVQESKSVVGKSLELYNLGELKYVELARETAGGKEANPEFVQKMWDIKTRQDQLLKDIVEFAKKLGIDTSLANVPLGE